MPLRARSVLFVVLLAASAALLARQAPSHPAASNATPDAIRLNNQGVASMNQQKFEPALGFFEKAAAADPAFTVAQVNAAIALMNLQRPDQARELLTKVTTADPQNVRAWYNLGLLLKSTGDGEASLAAFQKAAGLRPADAYTRYFVGLLASQLQQYDAAIASFQKALELDPFLVSAEFGLARAYQRAGKTDEAHAHLERFQRLTTQKIASAMSLAYGDQGPFSLAEAVMPASGAPAPAVPVTFTAITPGPFPVPASSGAPGVGAGACAFDANGDGLVDVLVLNPHAPSGGADAALLFTASASGAFTRVPATGLDLKQQPVGCTAADYDNDDKTDVAISLADGGVVLFHNEGMRFADATATAGIASAPGGIALGLSFADYDHDGDVDLIVPRSGAMTAPSFVPAASGSAHTLVWRNNGNGTFTEVSGERGLQGSGSDTAVVATDFNNDRAVDLVMTGGSTPAVYVNPREGVFKPLPWPQAPASPAIGSVVLDFDKDGWMDVALTHAGAPGISLWRNVDGTKVEPVPLPDLGLTRAWGLAAVDYDNDGQVDLVAAGEAGGTGRLVVLRNDRGRFTDASAAVGARALSLTAPRAVLSADVDADGDADLIVTSASGAPVVLRNDGGSANHAARLTFKGLADNKSGIGTKVEVQAGTVWQKFEIVSASGFLGQSAPEIVAGLGAEAKADVVRMLWPTGVVQDEIDVETGKPVVIEEVDRRGSSCPLLFTWNGRGYEFISDAVGPGVIGHWIAPHETNVPDPDEYLKIEGHQLVARDGRFSIKYLEPMEEVNYLDQVRLIAVDHPAGSDIYPNEYFAALAPPPAPTIVGVKDARPPAGAWDDRGRDVLPDLRARDRRFVPIADAPYRGFATRHALELDLGPLPSRGPVRLIMTGFTDYFTATSMFAAHQASVDALVPFLEAQTRDGRWVRVSDDIGFPAGLYRTMVADLTGRLPADAHRIRIWTNLKIYWDQVLVDTTPSNAVAIRTTEAPLREATLGFHGFPRDVPGTPAADLRYVYDEVSRFGPWARHRGLYTRYGSVTPLLQRIEDHFVIFGAGDEVSLQFDATALPPVPDGWTRDYLFYADSYVKDMDFYGTFAQTVTPLPFAAMRTYPYPASREYPRANDEYMLEWNTREVTSEAWPSYRLEFGGGR